MSKEELKKNYIEKAVAWIERKGYLEIKANIEGMEPPKSFTQRSKNELVNPDLTAKSLGRKFYFEIAMKTNDTKDLVTKWKLLSQLAAMKDGKLYLFVPHGHRSFAEKLVQKHKISAIIEPLRATN